MNDRKDRISYLSKLRNREMGLRSRQNRKYGPLMTRAYRLPQFFRGNLHALQKNVIMGFSADCRYLISYEYDTRGGFIINYWEFAPKPLLKAFSFPIFQSARCPSDEFVLQMKQCKFNPHCVVFTAHSCHYTRESCTIFMALFVSVGNGIVMTETELIAWDPEILDPCFISFDGFDVVFNTGIALVSLRIVDLMSSEEKEAELRTVQCGPTKRGLCAKMVTLDIETLIEEVCGLWCKKNRLTNYAGFLNYQLEVIAAEGGTVTALVAVVFEVPQLLLGSILVNWDYRRAEKQSFMWEPPKVFPLSWIRFLETKQWYPFRPKGRSITWPAIWRKKTQVSISNEGVAQGQSLTSIASPDSAIILSH